MKAIATVLNDNPVLKGMTPRSLEILGDCARNVSYEEGQVLFGPGEEADSFHILRAGEVGLVVPYEHGAIEVQKLYQGDLLGWSWMLPPYRWVLKARALTHVDAVKVDAKRLRGLFTTHPAFEHEVLKHLMPIVIQRLNALQLQLVDVYKAQAE
ncbi:MAG TPA: cyclic nucleotide-binding domain-containing protein [bacterium]|nr:cyclic nucleotide-binding domain-containing protein [bacterium]